MRTGLAPKKSAFQNPLRVEPSAGLFAAEGFGLKRISLVKPPERRPWIIEREDSRAALPGFLIAVLVARSEMDIAKVRATPLGAARETIIDPLPPR